MSKKTIYRVQGEKFVLNEHYKPLRILGHGSYGVVCEAIDLRTNQSVAIKKNRHVFRNVEDAKRMIRELKLLIHFDHQDIIQLVDVIAPDAKERYTFEDIYFVMPKMDSNLDRIIRSNQKLTRIHRQFIIYQILRGLKYIHSANVIHRDIKPENILIGSDCKIKISDFGLARGVCNDDNNDLTEYVVSRWYRAPEIMCSIRHYNEKVDVWSVGCIFAELYLRKPLFPAKSHIELLQLMFTLLGTPHKNKLDWAKTPQARQWIEAINPRKPQDLNTLFFMAEPLAIDFLRKMLVMDPNDRISVDEALCHPYLKILHNPLTEFSCEKFELSPEFKQSINTQFGVRYQMCELLNQVARSHHQED